MTHTSSRLATLNPAGLSGALTYPVRALRRHMLQGAARRQLMQLDDRMLSDIGLSRGGIENVVRQIEPR